jgi:excisionase family DNA binding protein
MTDRLLLDITDAMELTGLGRSKLYELIATGQLGSVKVGARRLIPADELQRFVDSLWDAQ